MLQDCFKILLSDEVRSHSDPSVAREAVSDQDEEVQEAVEGVLADTHLSSVVRPVARVLLRLNKLLEEKKSKLQNDVVRFLKEILMDYKGISGTTREYC